MNLPSDLGLGKLNLLLAASAARLRVEGTDFWACSGAITNETRIKYR